MLDFFRYYFLFFNSIIVFHKLIHPAPCSKLNKVINFILPCLLSCISFFPHFRAELFLLSIILLVIYFSFYTSNPKTAFVTYLLSFCISLCVFTISSLLITVCIILPIFKMNLDYENLFIIAMGLLQTLLIQFIFMQKRFKHGMPFLYSSTVINVGTFLGFLSIAIYAFARKHPNSTYQIQNIRIWAVLIMLCLFLHWWQSQLTKTYRKRLAQLELESLRTELEQKTALLKKLETQNEEMGRLIHKDNKLIPSMEHAVSSYLASGFTDIALQQAQGEALLSDLKEFSEARRGILSTFAPISAPKYNTGIPSLDAILVYMYQKAQVQDIRFYAAATPESIAALPPALTTKKLVHMLSDLLENAIIATKTSTEKQIQVQIYLANGLFTIEVADTGCSFEPATLISFGLEKASTHLTEGGSGIGLLDIWKIKEETKASIHIHEYEAGAPFSKKLFITFDKKNKYVIHTWRDKELSPLVNRGDIVILPQEQM